MRYAPESNLLFIHIPKAAGSSIRRAMEPWSRTLDAELGADIGQPDLDLTEKDSRILITHPVVGQLHHAHIPMPIMREHFPVTHKLVMGAEKFAVVRNPKQRFMSAVSQYLREIKGVGASHITGPLVRETAREVIGQIADMELIVDHRYTHFSKQSSFIEDPAMPAEVQVFSMERLGLLQDYLRERTGHEITLASTNATVRPKAGFAAIHKAMAVVGKLAPRAVRAKALMLFFKLPFYSRSWNSSDVEFDADVLTFIDEYYARDWELHRAAASS